jgi:DNA-binding MarR family transcriptional regulator
LGWDEELDLSIIKCLENNNKLHYNGLYERVCSTYRSVSPETFSSHIKRLVASGYIEKVFNGIGKKEDLSLTDKARRQVRMNTLDFKSARERANSKGISNKQLCVLLLLFRRPTIYKFDTEIGFDNFLSQFKLTRQQLIQTRYPKFVSISGDRKYHFKDTAWSSPSDDINITREDITHRIDASGKYHRVMQPEFYYYCTVKGLTEREIKTDIRLPSSFFKVTKAQAKKVFNSLRKEKLLKPIAKYNDEFIYAISDKRFDNFLQDCLEVYQSISDLIIGVWDSIRPPRSEEIQWLEFFIGKKGTDQVRIRADETRKAKHGMTTDEFREWLKWWKNALKSDYDAKNMVKDLIKKHKLTIEKYPYSNELLNHVYPNFLEDTLQFN